MKWYSVKKHRPPVDTVCFVISDNGFLYTGIIDSDMNCSDWMMYAEEKRSIPYPVTHFCIPGPVEIEEE